MGAYDRKLETIRVSGTVRFEGTISFDKHELYRQWFDEWDQSDPEQAAKAARYDLFEDWLMHAVTASRGYTVDFDWIDNPDDAEPESTSLADHTFYSDCWDHFAIKPVLIHREQGNLFDVDAVTKID